jgi:hypothetical protein
MLIILWLECPGKEATKKTARKYLLKANSQKKLMN